MQDNREKDNSFYNSKNLKMIYLAHQYLTLIFNSEDNNKMKEKIFKTLKKVFQSLQYK